MSKYLKFFLGISYILILTVFLYYVFSYIEIRRLNDFAYYKELQSNLNYYVNSNNFINLIYFFVFCIIWVFMLGFASPILIISGILFGKWIGTFATTISISIGALILYIFAGLFFSDLLQKILNKKFSKYIHLFKENEFIYFFAFRLSGGLGIPFFLQNLLPIIFKMNKSNYFFASLFGFIPHVFIWNTVGDGLSKYVEKSESFSLFKLILSPEIYTPIIMFLALILSSFIIKKKFFNVRNK